MSKTFIAAVVATAVAITSYTATPARAELSDIEKILLGAGALLIIGTVAEEARQAQKKKKRVVVQQHRPQVRHHAPQPVRFKPLPGYCLRNVNSFEGPRRIFGARCLQNNYRQVAHLPKRCKTWVEGPRGTRKGYRPRCLRNAGFQVAR